MHRNAWKNCQLSSYNSSKYFMHIQDSNNSYNITIQKCGRNRKTSQQLSTATVKEILFSLRSPRVGAKCCIHCHECCIFLLRMIIWLRFRLHLMISTNKINNRNVGGTEKPVNNFLQQL
jgi:hypothetical protein